MITHWLQVSHSWCYICVSYMYNFLCRTYNQWVFLQVTPSNFQVAQHFLYFIMSDIFHCASYTLLLKTELTVIKFKWYVTHFLRELHFIVYQIPFDKTRQSCSWNTDQNCAQNSDGGVGYLGVGCLGVGFKVPQSCFHIYRNNLRIYLL